MTIVKKLLLFVILMPFILIFCGKSEKQNTTTKISDNSAEDIQIILVINNKKFTNADLKHFISIKYRDIDSEKSSRKDMLLSRLFDSFIDNSLLLYYADKEKIEISDDELDKYIDSRKLSAKDFDKDYIKGILKIDKYLFSKIYGNISITDKEIKEYYKSNPELFTKKREIELYQIFLNNRDEAVKIRGELVNSPKLFDEIATEKSKSENKGNNGYVGKFQKGELPKEMESVVFSLKTNQISRVVQSKYGYHIFKVKKIRSARHEYLKNVSTEIAEKLKSEKISEAYNKYMSDLKNKTNIKIYYENLWFKYFKVIGETNEVKNNNNSAISTPSDR